MAIHNTMQKLTPRQKGIYVSNQSLWIALTVLLLFIGSVLIFTGAAEIMATNPTP